MAVAQALAEADPGGEVLLVSRRGGVAEDLVHAAGVRIETIPISGLDLSSLPSTVGFAWRLPGGVLRSLRIIRRFHTDVVVGAAGYVSAPVVVAARLARVPVVLLEQNAVPGRATRWLAGRAEMVACSYAETARYLPGVKVVHTGNPIRREVASLEPDPLSEHCSKILVMGGSQGARRLNDAVMAGLRELLAVDGNLTVSHQTGATDLERVKLFHDALPHDTQARYRLAPFFADVAREEAQADLVVMRAGGSSLAEVAAMGRPMLLVPYAHAGGHQQFNAEPYVAAGAALSVDDVEFSGNRLITEVTRLVRDPKKWRDMAIAAAKMGRPDAAAAVAQLIVGVAKRHHEAA